MKRMTTGIIQPQDTDRTFFEIGVKPLDNLFVIDCKEGDEKDNDDDDDVVGCSQRGCDVYQPILCDTQSSMHHSRIYFHLIPRPPVLDTGDCILDHAAILLI